MGIKDYKVGDIFTGPLLIKNVKKGKANNGSDFLAMTLCDATGDIVANIWNSTVEQEQTMLAGTILMVSGVISEFRSKRQINMQAFRLSNPDDNVDIGQLLQKAPINGNVMLTEIVNEIKQMENKNIQEITLNVLKNNSEKFKTHPAAKHVHHSYVSGLAYHTYNMMKIGKSLCDIYPVLNKDLLLAGIILHDIGKIVEYTGYMNTEPTLDGKLRGHITIVSEEIAMVAKELKLGDSQEKLLLQHMVLSHHGLQSNGWGSAVSPQIIEANILHRIDTIDAEIDMYNGAISETEEHEFTAKIWGMDNREFYKHGLWNPNIILK